MNCKKCIHYEACCRWTDFPKSCGMPTCSHFDPIDVNSLEKLKELINAYFGVDSMYYGVDSYDLASYLHNHGYLVNEVFEE